MPLETTPYTIDGKSHALRNTTLIGGGAAAGAILGGVAGGKKGAVIGSAIGAGAGTATAYMSGKQEIIIPSESNFSFTTSSNSASSSSRSEPDSEPWHQTFFPREKRDPGTVVDLIFSDRDRRIIREYFHERYSNLPPGLAKRGGNLPPGLEKHLQRNGRLPPGLQKRVEPFPHDLEIKLPRLPERIIRVILGRRAIIVDDQNNILDMIEFVVD